MINLENSGTWRTKEIESKTAKLIRAATTNTTSILHNAHLKFLKLLSRSSYIVRIWSYYTNNFIGLFSEINMSFQTSLCFRQYLHKYSHHHHKIVKDQLCRNLHQKQYNNWSTSKLFKGEQYRPQQRSPADPPTLLPSPLLFLPSAPQLKKNSRRLHKSHHKTKKAPPFRKN